MTTFDLTDSISRSLESIGLVEQHTGETEPTFDAGPTSLVLFLYRLLHRLQQCATVPAVDWPAYIAPLRAPRPAP